MHMRAHKLDNRETVMKKIDISQDHESRITRSEVIIENINQTLQDLRSGFDALNRKFDNKFDGLERKLDNKIDALEHKFDTKIDSLEHKFDTKIDSLEHKFDTKIDSLDRKFDHKFDYMNHKTDSNFKWLLTIMIGGFTATWGLIGHSHQWF
jgi:hypothetical protein